MAQVILHADTSSGCGNLDVQFSLLPSSSGDTITDIAWDFGNGITASGSLTPKVTYQSPGSFDVTVTINGSYFISEQGFIMVYPQPKARFYYSDTLDAGNYAFVFRPVNPGDDTVSYTYTWFFDGGSPLTGKSIFHDFDQPGNFPVKLVVEQSAGCVDSVISNVQVNELLKVPNIFTPNGDGMNDYFRIRTDGINRYIFSVYTRSGILVYKSESPNIIWDGRSFSGEEMHSGIYFFIINQINGDNRILKKGFVHLMR